MSGTGELPPAIRLHLPKKFSMGGDVVQILTARPFTNFLYSHIHYREGCALARTVSRWLLTVKTQVQCQSSPCGICGGHTGLGADFFLRTSLLPPQIIYSQMFPSYLLSGAASTYNRRT
jgi:hypothetical protein